jgi:hypothetical protein
MAPIRAAGMHRDKWHGQTARSRMFQASGAMLAANAGACRAGGMIGWIGVGHEAPPAWTRLAGAGSIRRPRAGRGGRLCPSLSLTASSPDHWLRGDAGAGQSSIQRWAPQLAVDGSQPPSPATQPSKVGMIAPLRSGGWDERHRSDELALDLKQGIGASRPPSALLLALERTSCSRWGFCQLHFGHGGWQVHDSCTQMARPPSSFQGLSCHCR